MPSDRVKPQPTASTDGMGENTVRRTASRAIMMPTSNVTVATAPRHVCRRKQSSSVYSATAPHATHRRVLSTSPVAAAYRSGGVVPCATAVYARSVAGDGPSSTAPGAGAGAGAGGGGTTAAVAGGAGDASAGVDTSALRPLAELPPSLGGGSGTVELACSAMVGLHAARTGAAATSGDTSPSASVTTPLA